MKIHNKFIGENNDAFIIAEISANHVQNFEIALKTIDAMKESGADAIKMQTFKPEGLTIECDNEYFRINQNTLWDGNTLHALYKEVYTPWEWQPKLKEYAEKNGLICFSSPFDNEAIDFLEEMNVPAYKVASFEIQDIPLIKYMASKGKPILISIGIAELQDIEEAVSACRKVGNNSIALLKCTSSYPAPIEEANLKTIPDLAERFDVIAGLSDHTLGISVPIAAVALGAKIIEKHFTLDKKLGGPDSAFSLEPAEFKNMVTAIREAEKAIGKVNYELSDKVKVSKIFGRSLFAVKNIKKGEVFTEKNIRSIRPGYGLHPKYYTDILGKRALEDISFGEPLKWDMIDKGNNFLY